ncbi:DNA-3-methyladenine glycosylase I [Celerinatantimonas sp. MCCC 1A17872]|uniref:DNA-3-methyladenine glycosylase I n=1 Tax=Celerinatantimonas sp. MCCC 1A17872 TaxID=3177514 RepID=UPI0038C7733B
MESYQSLYQRAVERKGSVAALEQLLSKPRTYEELIALEDCEWLEEFTRKIFQSGFYWSVVNAKWAGFREVFWNFSIEKLLLMPPEMLERKASDPQIIRNFKKVKTLRDNCLMIHDIAQKHGSFSTFIANFASEDIVQLWDYLKTHGSRLGGNTGAFALRAMGKDTFILSRDIEGYCRAYEVIDGGLHTKRSHQAIQAMFNQFREQSGRSYQELSQLIAYSFGDNTVGWQN